nr:E3 ubiquitin-protein ligase PRT1-like isoform X1 [Tanacetum cinerariifolium]
MGCLLRSACLRSNELDHIPPILERIKGDKNGTKEHPKEDCSVHESASGIYSPLENKLKDRSSAKNYKQITVADVLCAACKQLLFRPVALNCGHVYCEAYITIPKDGVIKCHVCEFRHPNGFPKVCKELENILQEQLLSDYSLKSSTQLTQEQIQSGNPLAGEFWWFSSYTWVTSSGQMSDYQ